MGKQILAQPRAHQTKGDSAAYLLNLKHCFNPPPQKKKRGWMCLYRDTPPKKNKEKNICGFPSGFPLSPPKKKGTNSKTDPLSEVHFTKTSSVKKISWPNTGRCIVPQPVGKNLSENTPDPPPKKIYIYIYNIVVWFSFRNPLSHHPRGTNSKTGHEMSVYILKPFVIQTNSKTQKQKTVGFVKIVNVFCCCCFLK